jgi:hypothetical protein
MRVMHIQDDFSRYGKVHPYQMNINTFLDASGEADITGHIELGSAIIREERPFPHIHDMAGEAGTARDVSKGAL